MNLYIRLTLAGAALLLLHGTSAASPAPSQAPAGAVALQFGKRIDAPSCALGPVAGRISGDFTQIGRIKRDSRPSTCNERKPFPGVLDGTRSYHYQTLSYANPSNVASCVLVRFDAASGATPCYTNAHVAAYADRYDPDDQAANFLGDIGSNTASEFAFELPAGTDLVLAFSNTTVEQGCDFNVEVLNLDCSGVTGVGADRQNIPVDDGRALVLMAVLLVLLGNLAVVRQRG